MAPNDTVIKERLVLRPVNTANIPYSGGDYRVLDFEFVGNG